jgi:hypothetical protein
MTDWTNIPSRGRSGPRLASSSRAPWILAASCAVIGVLLKLADVGSQAPAPPRAPAATTVAQRTGADGPFRHPDDTRTNAEFPTILGPGFHPDRPSPVLEQRTQRAIAHAKLRKTRRAARLRAKREGTSVRTLTDADGNSVPYEVVEQGEQYPTNTPVEAAELAEKLGGLRGSVSLWLQPQWQEGNQDDASLVEIADGQLRLVKNVNFLRLEFMDDDGAAHGIGAPITGWKTGEWHQIAGSWDTNTFQLYFDGELVRETTIDGPFFLQAKPRVLVGSDFPQDRPVAPGMVGGLEVHKRPLSPYEAMKRFVGAVG